MTSTVQFATVFMFLVIQYGSSLNLKSTKVRYKLHYSLLNNIRRRGFIAAGSRGYGISSQFSYIFWVGI